MRKHLASLVFAGCALAVSPAAAAREDSEARVAEAPVAVQQVRTHGLRDEAAMVLIGTALIGLAAAVRRAA